MASIDLTPASVDLLLYAGDGVSIELVLTQDDLPFDTTGEVAAQIRTARTDDAIKASFTVDNSDPATGVVGLSLTGEQTAALMNGERKFKGAWDCQIVPTGAEPITLVQGSLICAADVTRVA